LFEDEEEYRENDESHEWDYDRPTEESVVAFFFIFEIRIITHCRGARSKLSEPRQKNRGIDEDASKAHLLCSKIFGHNEKGGEESNYHPEIIHY
jgi:hypothetical protein